jgi:5-methyltetrahydrofolate--homocysteine methyltransferase
VDWLTKTCGSRIVVFDGGMGTALQGFQRPGFVDGPRAGTLPFETCNEALVDTQPEVVRRVHEQFLAAGADAIETNSFGGAQHTLAEQGLGENCFELNRRAAEIKVAEPGAHYLRRTGFELPMSD